MQLVSFLKYHDFLYIILTWNFKESFNSFVHYKEWLSFLSKEEYNINYSLEFDFL